MLVNKLQSNAFIDRRRTEMEEYKYNKLPITPAIIEELIIELYLMGK